MASAEPGAVRDETAIEVNGEPRRVPEGCTIRGLLDLLDTGEKRVAVAVNGEVVPRSDHASVSLGPGDRVEVLEAVGGG